MSSRNSYCSLPDTAERRSAYIGGVAVYEEPVDGIQLLRYVAVPPSLDNSVEYLDRPKSELVIRRKFDPNRQVTHDDCVRYASQDLGPDGYSDTDMSFNYSPIVVVAIDFGTTYSGYAFSFIHDAEDIHMMRKWEGLHLFPVDYINYQNIHFLVVQDTIFEFNKYSVQLIE